MKTKGRSEAEFLAWAAREWPLSGGTVVTFTPSGRRFDINVRHSDLEWCFLERDVKGGPSWTFPEFLPWAATQTRTLIFSDWRHRLNLRRPKAKK